MSWFCHSKKLIKRLRQRLIIQKNRRNVMMRQLHADIAQLLHNGQHKSALARVATTAFNVNQVLQLQKDQDMLSAYDQLEKFCDCVEDSLGKIHSKSRNLSVEVCEAVSSLIFAASRCGELPELQSIGNLFKELLGLEFERANVELLPGNTVNSQIKHNLSVKSIAEDMKTKLINDIAREYKHYLEQPIQVQARNLSEDVSNGLKDQTQTKNFEEMLPEIGSTFALTDCKDMVTFWSNFHDGSGGIGRSFNSLETNEVTLQKKNHEDFSQRTISNDTTTKIEAAILCFHDKRESLQDREFVREHQFTTLDSCKTSSVRKDVDEKCDDQLIKADLIDARYGRSVAADSSQNEEVIRDQVCQNNRDIGAECCLKDGEENPRSPITHVHPKLPDYDYLVFQFTNLKKEYMENN
ncbi:hypothetical protein ACH5RR_028042 [Cinchona calisaya]|uniref:IST1-like protein n=1 Tax=Cinchona calisaya TaxID=153742 RepID=A0ABD2YMK6_9GENT